MEARGGAVLAAAPAAAFQARRLARKGWPFELLLDPDDAVRSALAFGRIPLLRFLTDARGWGRWLSGFLRAGQGLPAAPPSLAPGALVLDGGARPVWVHEGRGLGDYPPLSTLLTELERSRPGPPEGPGGVPRPGLL